MDRKKPKSHLDYLDKTYLEELNLKIWSTRGSRFGASLRLAKMAKLSNLSTSLLSGYLIAVGLMTVYNVHNSGFIEENVLAYGITLLSILSLVFAQYENTQDYNGRAKSHHECGLELSTIYSKLRIFKTLNSKSTEEEKKEFAEVISSEYDLVLKKYENHEDIDHDIFRASKGEYYELSRYRIWVTWLHYYRKTLIKYHLLIVCPPLLIALFLSWKCQ